MDITIEEGDNGDIVGVVELTEPECDTARSTTSTPLSEGAFSVGTSYYRDEGDFSFTVRASDEETVRQASQAWLDEIHERLDEN